MDYDRCIRDIFSLTNTGAAYGDSKNMEVGCHDYSGVGLGIEWKVARTWKEGKSVCVYVSQACHDIE